VGYILEDWDFSKVHIPSQLYGSDSIASDPVLLLAEKNCVGSPRALKTLFLDKAYDSCL